MSHRVLVLRPEADFARVDAMPPAGFDVAYHGPADAEVPALMKTSAALVIPAVGPKLAPALFEGTSLKLVQVTGAGVDRLDQAALTKLGIPVANVAGGSNSAVAEYAVTAASTLLRRMAWSDAEIKNGNYVKFRARMVADNLAGIEGLLVGLVGFGTIGRAVAKAFEAMGCRICYFDPAGGTQAVGPAVRVNSLQELLTTADVVSLHVPLLPETQNLIGARELSMMKKDAVLIQAARGHRDDARAEQGHEPCVDRPDGGSGAGAVCERAGDAVREIRAHPADRDGGKEALGADPGHADHERIRSAGF